MSTVLTSFPHFLSLLVSPHFAQNHDFYLCVCVCVEQVFQLVLLVYMCLCLGLTTLGTEQPIRDLSPKETESSLGSH